MPVTRMLQLNMKLDLFQIKACEELLNCRHCESNLMQFKK